MTSWLFYSPTHSFLLTELCVVASNKFPHTTRQAGR